MTDKIVVLSTCASPKEAHRVAHALVEKRLAACVNILPGARSVYHWKDAVEDEEEVLLVIKTSRELFDRLRSEIERLHTYELPEVIALPIVDGSQGYLTWLDHELAEKHET
ncbi:MAG TPA: divalent-cation tolerance protein CutA [Bryobacteraceae bacterium]|nr:divalent-cation tolerance protein CutA [Bryobacteraceae bacterium]